MGGVKRALPVLIFLTLSVLTRLPVLHRAVLDWDESLYFLMAQQWRLGHLPYTNVWDNKPLGIYVIFAAFQAVIPGIAAIRMATMLFVALLACTVFRITEILTASRQAAWLAGVALVLASLSNDGLSANTELFMASFTALAVLGVLAEVPSWVVGLALGCAVMVKDVAITEAPCIFLLLLYRQRDWRAGLSCLLGAAAPLAAALALYAANGQLPLWWECNVLANLRRAGVPLPASTVLWGLQTQAARWGGLYAAALLLALLGRGRSLAALFPPLWLLCALAGAASAKSFYDHYFLQALPPLCICLGALYALLPPRLPLRAALVAAALAQPLRAAQQAMAYAISPDIISTAGADLAAQHPTSLYVFDAQPILYALANTPLPTRYVLPSVLTRTTLPRVAGVDAPAEVARILATRPQFIARRAPAPNDLLTNQAIYAALDAALAQNYTLWRAYPGMTIYKRLNP
jgi:4-amino-4-deoxy-L-arabinose transferase-like glycosyltransferase